MGYFFRGCRESGKAAAAPADSDAPPAVPALYE